VGQPRNLKQHATEAGYHCVDCCRHPRRRISDTAGLVYLFIAAADVESGTAGVCNLPFACSHNAFGFNFCVSPHRAPAQVTSSINSADFVTALAVVFFDRVYRVGASEADATANRNTAQQHLISVQSTNSVCSFGTQQAKACTLNFTAQPVAIRSSPVVASGLQSQI
jgi:hypothetical protein